jgi:hypothetical protein
MEEEGPGDAMKARRCSRCGKRLLPGGLVYIIQVRIFADFDGVLIEPSKEIDREIEDLLEEIEQSDPKELEKEVYEEYTLLLCKPCRDLFVKETRPSWEGPFQVRKDPEPVLH